MGIFNLFNKKTKAAVNTVQQKIRGKSSRALKIEMIQKDKLPQTLREQKIRKNIEDGKKAHREALQRKIEKQRARGEARRNALKNKEIPAMVGVGEINNTVKI